jgi:hypothetical protein
MDERFFVYFGGCMSLLKKYDPKEAEPRIEKFWQEGGAYHFDLSQPGEIYSIDTPPPTVSGLLHLGHIYSYSHTDFIARFKRMQGYRVFYPMGFDDNGLPTERFVEKRLGKKAKEVGKQKFMNALRSAKRWKIIIACFGSVWVYRSIGVLLTARLINIRDGLRSYHSLIWSKRIWLPIKKLRQSGAPNARLRLPRQIWMIWSGRANFSN